MKGPGLRADLDVRRVWKCPACGRIRRTPGNVLSVQCTCTENGVWMKLDEPKRSRDPFAEPRPVVVEVLAAELVDEPQPEPVSEAGTPPGEAPATPPSSGP